MAVDISRCKCCLEGGRLESMWQDHYSNGLREVYGIMLIDCFALPWSRPENSKNSPDLICDLCITRLKAAVSFKTEVLASDQLLSGQLQAMHVEKVKEEYSDVDVNIQAEYINYEDNYEDNDDNNPRDIEDSCDNNDCTSVSKFIDDREKHVEADKEKEEKWERHPTPEDLPILSDTEEISRKGHIAMVLRKRVQSADVVHRAAVDNRDMSQTMTTEKYEVSRKARTNAVKNEDELKSPGRKRVTKQEIADFEKLTKNLRKSIEAVKNKKMSEAKAATLYNVPRKLISKEINRIPKVYEWRQHSREAKNNVLFIEVQKTTDNEKEDLKKTITEIKDEIGSIKTGSRVKKKDLGALINKPVENRLTEMKKQANNIAIILECTNATPIRRHGGIGYGCCFCDKEFPNAADLKQHTIGEHDVKTKRNYAKGKRPSAYLVKLDITDLKCNLCGNVIDSLEQLYDHLIETHKKLLYKNAKNYIVPFKFDQEELRCLFCEFFYNSFKGLLEHMSVHYRNHICDVCDAGFLTKNNLFNHAGRHKKGTFKCDKCPKVFDTSSKRAGHQRLVHSSSNGVNRCGYCGEMFGTYRRKEKHLMSEHGVTLKKLKCKACDKTFETQTGLRIHTKRDHLIERRFKCSVCDKRCFTNVQLNQHILKHTGVKKFQCTICLKAYGRKSTLREHIRIHENDRRFKCDVCGMAFVQKCSWRGHMLSKHGQQI